MIKLNNRGWGLRVFILGLGIFAIALLIVVMLVHNKVQFLEPKHKWNEDLYNEYNKTPEKENESYSTLENKVVAAARKYANDKYNVDFEDNTTITVTVKKLQKEKLLDSVKDLKNTNKKCSGYVTFYKKSNNFYFSPYINCKNYKTKGYEERLDDK